MGLDSFDNRLKHTTLFTTTTRHLCRIETSPINAPENIMKNTRKRLQIGTSAKREPWRKVGHLQEALSYDLPSPTARMPSRDGAGSSGELALHSSLICPVAVRISSGVS